jgi:ABC-type uncharacterized transport system, duplicated ATPase component
MKNKIKYVDAPKSVSKSLEIGKVVSDFLPPPELLVKKEPRTKITISLTARSLNFFKTYAKRSGMKYQTMINEVLDVYSQKYNLKH